MSVTTLKTVKELKSVANIALIADKATNFKSFGFGKPEMDLIASSQKNKINPVYLQHNGRHYWIAFNEKPELTAAAKEQARKNGAKMVASANA
jgi:hypothetical protein